MALKTGQPGRKFIKTRLKKGDPVIVIAGAYKGKQDTIEDIDRKRGLVLIKGVNRKKHFIRRTEEYPTGTILEIEAPIHISNVMYFCDNCKKGVRIKVRIEEIEKDGKKKKKKIRVCAKCGKVLDK